ncbi:hypothetical protein J6590_022296 [Homalodisca vitripennis]|nr:hypothetical protein J6590_022296 [Homalodisca vitripennis]
MRNLPQITGYIVCVCKSGETFTYLQPSTGNRCVARIISTRISLQLRCAGYVRHRKTCERHLSLSLSPSSLVHRDIRLSIRDAPP